MPREQSLPPRSNFLLALGKAFREVRTENGLSQEQVAEGADMDVGHLGEIERGQGNPTAETWGRMVEALETSFGRVGELTDGFLAGKDWWSVPDEVGAGDRRESADGL